MINKIMKFPLRGLTVHAALSVLISLTFTAAAQDYYDSPVSHFYDARPLAVGTSIVRQPVGPRMYRLSGNNYFVDWNFSPSFAVEGKFEQADTPPCNDNDNQIMSYKAYEVGLRGSIPTKYIQPTLAGYFGSGWVNRRESGVLWHEPNTALIGLTLGFDAGLPLGTKVRFAYQSSRWIPFWPGSTNQNTNYVSVGVVHRFNASFGREWRR
jgi:hypothetical protein